MDLVPTLATNYSGAFLRWTLFTSSISLILQQDDDHILASSPWTKGSRLILP